MASVSVSAGEALPSITGTMSGMSSPRVKRVWMNGSCDAAEERRRELVK